MTLTPVDRRTPQDVGMDAAVRSGNPSPFRPASGPQQFSQQPYMEPIITGQSPAFMQKGNPLSPRSTPQRGSPFSPVQFGGTRSQVPNYGGGAPHIKQPPRSASAEMGTIPHLRLSAVSPYAGPPRNQSGPMVGKWSMAALRETDGIIPAQYGSNRFASRKLMTDFGAPRDVHGKHFHRLLEEDPNTFSNEEQMRASDAIIGGQYGSNRFASRKLYTDFGAPRDVHGKHFHRLMEEDPSAAGMPEELLRASDAIIGGQYGSNRFASRKLMTDFGAPRDTHGKHFHRLLEDDPSNNFSEDSLRASDAIIGGQYGSNRFASRKLMTDFGAPRDTHGKHYHRLLEDDADASARFNEEQLRATDAIIGGQYGSNRFASRKLMTDFGAPRDTHGKHYHRLMEDDPDAAARFNEEQLRATDAIIGGQYGSNRYASRKGQTDFGAPRDTHGKHYHRAWEEDPSFSNWHEPALRAADAVIGGQYGTNKFDSQSGMTKFGTPRDVHGPHMHRLADQYEFSNNMVI